MPEALFVGYRGNGGLISRATGWPSSLANDDGFAFGNILGQVVHIQRVLGCIFDGYPIPIGINMNENIIYHLYQFRVAQQMTQVSPWSDRLSRFR